MKKINESYLLDKFLEFEFANNLFENSILNVKYWHLIRFTMYEQIQNHYFDIGEAHTNLRNTSKVKKVLLKIKQFKYFILNNPLLVLMQKDILILNHQRRIKENDYYTCLYTDLLIEELKQSNIVLEEPILEKHYRPVKHPNVLYTDYINFIVAIKKRLLRKKPSKNDKLMILDLTNSINTTFNTTFKADELEEMIYNTVINFKYRIKYYKRILKRIKPKVIIEVVSYGINRYVVNHVAKELNIPTIELQHGTMGKYHIAYNFKERINLTTFPDYIFTFGQFWKDNTRFPIKGENIKVVGWPYLENKVSTYEKSIDKNDNKKTILFISQGTIGKPLSKIAVELCKLLNDNYNIIYKLHPGEYARWKTEYPWLIDSNIEIIDHSNHDMHYYFANADIQVGVYSTALFEGLAHDIKTFILPFYGYLHMENLIKEGLVKLVIVSNDLYDEMKSVNDKNDKNDKNEYLWATNSITKMKNEIDSIIKEHSNDFKT